ncbi:hypothetical protein BCP01_069 [Bacillus phage BCP01]|nr:hypothetical protein BCP01_069 [Bacillus phage BCP01]
MEQQLPQPQGKQINPKHVFNEQQAALFDLLNENIRLKAFIAQLQEDNEQLKANQEGQQEKQKGE